MKASETHLGKILEGTNQFVVSLSQRPYTWDESRWKVLWADLLELCEDETETSHAKPHFMGSIVTVPTRSLPEGVTKFLLIDGQQRLTTLQVLLTALRDSARGLPGSLAEKLEKNQLVKLLLSLYADYDAGSLSTAQFTAILDTLEDYFIRRFVCGVPTYGLNKILAHRTDESPKNFPILDRQLAYLPTHRSIS